MKSDLFISSTTLILFVSLPACTTQSGELQILDAWVRPAGLGGNAAIYFKIVNTGSDERLLGATTSAAAKVEIHESLMDDSGTVRMQQRTHIELPEGQTIEFKPGGLHLMLMNLSQDLREGDILSVSLAFMNAGEIELDVPIQFP